MIFGHFEHFQFWALGFKPQFKFFRNFARISIYYVIHTKKKFRPIFSITKGGLVRYGVDLAYCQILLYSVIYQYLLIYIVKLQAKSLDQEQTTHGILAEFKGLGVLITHVKRRTRTRTPPKSAILQHTNIFQATSRLTRRLRFGMLTLLTNIRSSKV